MTIKEFCELNKKKTRISFMGKKKIFKEADAMLDSNEEVLYAVVYIESLQYKVLVITSKRVFTCTDTGVSIFSEMLYLKDITSIDNLKGGLFKNSGGILIKGVTQSITISGINVKLVIDEIMQIIMKAKEDLEVNNSNVSSTSSLNYLEELEKLADLKEKGILSEEEFNSKKQQILDNNK